MLKKSIKDILSSSKKQGWVLEPQAKRILEVEGLTVPKFKWVKQMGDATRFANKMGYPVVAKIVSAEVLHKSDVNGVVTGIDNDTVLKEVFERFSSFKGFAGILIEEMLSGLELIVGAKIDYQFGPVILLGIGGTEAELYQDTSLRMAPLEGIDVTAMVKGLKAHQSLEGYRGKAPVNMKELTRLLLAFSRLVMKLEPHIESIDMNPVMCFQDRCVVADARIILKA